MADLSCRPGRVLRADDDVLTWEGAVDLEHTGEWSRAWRLPLSRLALFPGEGLRQRALMQAGVRIVLGTDAAALRGRAVVADLGDATADEASPVDLVVDGRYFSSSPVTPDGDFGFDLPAGQKTVELWLPQFGDFRLSSLEIAGDARLWRVDPRPRRPKLITYGSSITQCRTAASPTRTWPALVARDLDMDLTCLGYGNQCHLDPMIARMIRDMPADVIVTCLGINVYGNGSFNERSFLPAVLGLLSTIRDGHPGVPILVISPIAAPSREDLVGKTGMTLAQVRDYVAEAARLLREHGDDDLHILDGRDVFGAEQAHLLIDHVHPGSAGYAHMAASIAPAIRTVMSP
ncbi:GDSL family lipase [Phytoactinopolyspora alkaliphila]|uniref:GDSL family lipase n=1 Tax=Phytoactinopolyspora alkaliphila TaxID=1783498 RepID=A0A6N9YP73_9ACTN|nr:SGNH/GDSL hydrolase family protein [Phytoactinopolyspora alkaliphila]NED96772.1 GDSL family lipase [Phytoactinopolyspora alkaliphila]